MTLLRNSVIFLLLLSWCSCDTKGDFEGDFKNYFLKYFGEDGNQFAVDMHVNSDGTILVLGRTEVPVGPKRIFLLKTDAEGNVLWQKKFGGYPGFASDDEYPQDLEPISDGNFYVLTNTLLGVDNSNNENIYDFKVIRISPEGDLIDSLVFGNNGGQWKTQFIYSITAMSAGGFAVTGNSTDDIAKEPLLPSPPPDLEDLVAIGFNSDYTVQWQVVEFGNTAGSTGEHFGSGIKCLDIGSGNLYLSMYSDKNTSINPITYESNFNSFVATTNGILTSAFAAGKAGTQEVMAESIKVPLELGGGFYEIGSSSSQIGEAGSLYYCRRTSSLNLISEGEIIGAVGNFHAVSVAPSIFSDGFLILADEVVTAGTTIRLIKTNLDNDVTMTANFGSFNTENTGAQVAELPDGRILVLGTIELETQKKIALIKVNQNGEFLN